MESFWLDICCVSDEKAFNWVDSDGLQYQTLDLKKDTAEVFSNEQEEEER